MATTVAGDVLMYFTTAAKPPLKGLFSPLPNNPSTTTCSAVSTGGTNCVVISWKSIPATPARRSLFVSQSGDNAPLVLKRYTSTQQPRSASRRETASASPPLLPGPANTVKGVSALQRSDIARANAREARSIRSMDETGSFSIV